MQWYSELFGLTAMLIILVVGVAIGITIQRAQKIAKTTVDTSISGAVKLFQAFEKQRLQQLNLSVTFLGSDPAFFALVQSAMMAEGDTTQGQANAAANAPPPVQSATPAAPVPPHIRWPLQRHSGTPAGATGPTSGPSGP